MRKYLRLETLKYAVMTLLLFAMWAFWGYCEQNTKTEYLAPARDKIAVPGKLVKYHTRNQVGLIPGSPISRFQVQAADGQTFMPTNNLLEGSSLERFVEGGPYCIHLQRNTIKTTYFERRVKYEHFMTLDKVTDLPKGKTCETGRGAH